jgi:hypothetical protein
MGYGPSKALLTVFPAGFSALEGTANDGNTAGDIADSSESARGQTTNGTSYDGHYICQNKIDTL